MACLFSFFLSWIVCFLSFFCGALGLREQFDAAVAAGELLELLESLPRGAVEASVRLLRGYTLARAGGPSPFSLALTRSAGPLA